LESELEDFKNKIRGLEDELKIARENSEANKGEL